MAEHKRTKRGPGAYRKGRPKRQRRKRQKSAHPSSAIVKVDPQQIQLASAAPTFKSLVENVEKIRRFVSKHLNVDLQRQLAKLQPGEELDRKERERLEIDWGTIPGVDKPFLKQPGAEKACLWLHAYPKYFKETAELGDGHLEMVCHVSIHSKRTREELYEGPDCSCSSMESNFRFRWVEREGARPDPEESQRLKSQGLGKWKKKAVWAHGKKTGEEWVWLDRFENPNIHDERNKVRQIGEKRALVKAVRGMGAMSEIFVAGPDEWNMEDTDDDDPYLHDQDFTPGGRKIVTQDGRTPSGIPVTHEAMAKERGPRMPVAKEYTPGVPVTGSHEAAQAVLKEKLAKAPTSKAPENTQQAAPAPQQPSNKKGKVPESEYRKDNVPQSTSVPPMKFRGTIELDRSDPKSPIIRGDIAELLDPLKEKFVMEWSGDWWRYLPGDHDALVEFIASAGYALNISQSSVPGTAMGAEHPAAKGRGTSPSGAPAAVEANEPTLVTGMIEQINEKMTKGAPPTKTSKGRASVPYLSILFMAADRKKTFYSVFDQDMFPFLQRAKAKNELCRLFVKKSGQFANVVGLKSIGAQEFEDGKVPVIQQKDREAGGRTLFNA